MNESNHDTDSITLELSTDSINDLDGVASVIAPDWLQREVSHEEAVEYLLTMFWEEHDV